MGISIGQAIWSAVSVLYLYLKVHPLLNYFSFPFDFVSHYENERGRLRT